MTIRIQKLSRALIRRSIRLIDMEYKPAEMADELGANREQIIRLVTAGAPARKDTQGHYWINGLRFAQWLETAAPKNDRDKQTVEDNEAYCFQCKSKVIFSENRRVRTIIYGTCPQGHNVARIFSTKPKSQKTIKKGKGNRA